MAQRSTRHLTEHEAFAAMREYLLLHAGHGDNAATLAADMTLETDGAPTDPATWDDWIVSIRKVTGEDPSYEAAVLEVIRTLRARPRAPA